MHVLFESEHVTTCGLGVGVLEVHVCVCVFVFFSVCGGVCISEE